MSSYGYFVVIVDILSSVPFFLQSFFFLYPLFEMPYLHFVLDYRRYVTWEGRLEARKKKERRDACQMHRKRIKWKFSNARGNEYGRTYIQILTQYPQHTAENETSKQETEREREKTELDIKIKSQLMYRNEEHLLATYTNTYNLTGFLLRSLFTLCVCVYSKWNWIELSFATFTFRTKLLRRGRRVVTILSFYASVPVDELLNHFSFFCSVCFSYLFTVNEDLLHYFFVFPSQHKTEINNKK